MNRSFSQQAQPSLSAIYTQSSLNFWLYTLLILFLLFCFKAFSQQLLLSQKDNSTMPTERLNIVYQGNLETNFETNTVIYKGKVALNFSDKVKLFADYVEYNPGSQLIYLNGNVRFYQPGSTYYADKMIYNYQEKTFSGTNVKVSLYPFFLKSHSIELKKINNSSVLFAENAEFSFQNRSDPDSKILAEKVNVYLSYHYLILKKTAFIANNGTLVKFPILWLPLNKRAPYFFILGSSTHLGKYLLLRQNDLIRPQNNIQNSSPVRPTAINTVQLDFYGKRGTGLGIESRNITSSKSNNHGKFKLYYIDDKSPNTSRSSSARTNTDNNRYALEWKQRLYTDNNNTLTPIIDINLNYYSDQYYLEDFDEDQFKLQPEAISQLSLRWENPQNLIVLSATGNLDDSYANEQRTPELTWGSLFKPVFFPRILHSSKYQLGVYRESLAPALKNQLEAELNTSTPERLETINTLLTDKDFLRFHTYQDLSIPWFKKQGLSVNSKLGGAYTGYANVGSENEDYQRFLFSANLEAKFSFYKKYLHTIFPKLGINQLIHIIESYAGLSKTETNKLIPENQRIDRKTNNLDSLTFYTSNDLGIDSLQDQKFTRLGLKTQYLTYREKELVEWMYLNAFVDISNDQGSSDSKQKLLQINWNWRPFKWVGASFNTQLEINEGKTTNYSSYYSSLNFLLDRYAQLGIIHRSLDSHPALNDSDEINVNLHLRLSPSWGISTQQRWDLETKELEQSRYQLYRDFTGFILGVGITQNNNQNNNSEIQYLFNFSMKEIPSSLLQTYSYEK